VDREKEGMEEEANALVGSRGRVACVSRGPSGLGNVKTPRFGRGKGCMEIKRGVTLMGPVTFSRVTTQGEQLSI